MSLIPTTTRPYAAGHQADFFVDVGAGYQFVGQYIGPTDLPGVEINDNFAAVEGIGWYRDLAQVPGRNEPSLNGTLRIANGNLLQAMAVRNPATGNFPSATVPGFNVRLRTAQYTREFVGCYFQELRFQFQENGDMTCQFQIQAIWAGETDTDAVQLLNTQAGSILRWQHLRTVLVGDAGPADIRPYLSGCNVAITNNIQRVGFRPDDDPSCPRGAYQLIPLMEKLQVSYQLHTPLLKPAAADLAMGKVILTANNPAPHSLVITIDNSHMARRGSQQAGANAILAFTCDVAAYGITIVAS